MFWLAGHEGLLSNSSTAPSLHAGLRTRLSGSDWEDHEDDTAQNWVRISADDIDDIGTAGVIKAIMDTFATAESENDPVYLSIDIDVLDPGMCCSPFTRDVLERTERSTSYYYNRIIMILFSMRVEIR